jgi:hypothetical protein
VAAPPDDARPQAPVDVLPPASPLVRMRLGVTLVVVAVLAVLLVAGGAPVAVRAPVMLLAATFLPGYALVVRLPVDLPTLLAIDACVSLAIDASLAFLMVQTRFWFPLGLGLGLAVAGVGGALVAVTALRAQVRS